MGLTFTLPARSVNTVLHTCTAVAATIFSNKNIFNACPDAFGNPANAGHLIPAFLFITNVPGRLTTVAIKLTTVNSLTAHYSFTHLHQQIIL
jgi:Na+-transporting NADH:ubiquinone oxidoreductase subunit NqrB